MYSSFTASYLQTFYRDRPPTNDERAVLRFLVDRLPTLPPDQVVLEVGCGPTVHHTFPFVPYVSEIHMADYLAENLTEIDKWRNAGAGAMDWGNYSRLVLEMEGGPASDDAIHRREAEARAKIRRLIACDLKQPLILGTQTTYPSSPPSTAQKKWAYLIAAWERVMGHLAGVVAPGGYLFLACLRDTSGYLVGDTTYPCAHICDADLLRVLPRARLRHESVRGRSDDRLRVRSVKVSSG